MYLRIALLSCLLPLTTAQYIPLDYGTSGKTVGPDGPWWPLILNVGTPKQDVWFHPVIYSSASWWVASSTCSLSGHNCVTDSDNYYDTATASARTDWHLQNKSTPYQLIFGTAASVMNYNASGVWHEDSVQLSDSLTATNVANAVSNDTSISFPGGASYVPLSTLNIGTGCVYLVSSTNSSDHGTCVVGEAARQDAVTTPSWSAHLGSTAMNQSGSLILGGYDANRVMGSPGTYTADAYVLQSISLTTYNNSKPIQAVTGHSLNITGDPSTPYMYLPGAVCTTLAGLLPVSYNQALNLYTWNDEATWDGNLVNRLSYFTFQFDQVSINIPLALLYLTLEAPLVSSPTRYFPCYPSIPSTDRYILGRAFLQSSFIARSASAVFFGQAPGPDGNTTSDIHVFQGGQQALTIGQQSYTWEETWNRLINASNTNETVTDPGPSSNGSATDTHGLSGGAIAGIVIGIVAAIAGLVVVLLLVRKRRSTREIDGPVELDNQARFQKLEDKKQAGWQAPSVPIKYQAIEIGQDRIASH